MVTTIYAYLRVRFLDPAAAENSHREGAWVGLSQKMEWKVGKLLGSP